ncbi:unnamed protein product, partial [Nezara viridula]
HCLLLGHHKQSSLILAITSSFPHEFGKISRRYMCGLLRRCIHTLSHENNKKSNAQNRLLLLKCMIVIIMYLREPM